MPKRSKTVPEHKQAVLQIRLDPVLAKEAAEKAQPLGGLSAVIRAMLRRWVESGGVITDNDVLQELVAAPRRPRLTPRKPPKE
jgi:hypothetical protein